MTEHNTLYIGNILADEMFGIPAKLQTVNFNSSQTLPAIWDVHRQLYACLTLAYLDSKTENPPIRDRVEKSYKDVFRSRSVRVKYPGSH